MMPSPRHDKNLGSRTAAAVRYASFAVAFALAAGIAVAFALPGDGGAPPRSVVAATPTATATATPTATAVATTPAKLYYENEQEVDTPGSYTWPERLTEYRPNTFRAGGREFRLKYNGMRRVGVFWYQGQLRFAWSQPESLTAPHSIADLTFEVRAGNALSGDFPGSAAQPAISQGVHKGWRYYEQTLSTAYPSLNAAALGDGIAFTLRVFDTALGRAPLHYENEQEVDTPGSHTWPERLTEYRPNTFRAGDREFRLKSGARRVGIFWYQGQLRFAWTQPDTLTAPHSIDGLTFRIRLGDALSGDFPGSAAQPAVTQGASGGWRYYEQTLSAAYPNLNAAALGDGLAFTLRVFDTVAMPPALVPAKLYYENEQRVDTPGSHTWPERLTEYRPNTFRAGDREFRLKSSARRVGIFWYQGQLRFAWTQPESLTAPHSIADLTFEVRAGNALSGDFPGSAAQPAISRGVSGGWRYYEQTLSTAYPSLTAAALGDGIAFTLRVFDTAAGRVPLRYGNTQRVDTPGSHTWPERLTEYRPNTFRAGDREFRLKYNGMRRVGVFWYQGQLRFAWSQPESLTAPHSIADLTFRIRLGDALSGDFHGSAAQPAVTRGVSGGWRYYEQTLSTAYPNLNAAALGDGLTFTLRVFDSPPCWNGTAVANPASNLGLVGDCAALLEAKAVLIGTGTGTLNWSDGLAIASWEGVGLTSSVPKRVKSLSLSGQRLAGEIPAQLGKLDGLTILNLARNSLSGNIPSDLGGLTELDTLNLGGNTGLTGCIPPSLRDVEDNDLGNLGLPNCAAPASAATPTAPSG